MTRAFCHLCGAKLQEKSESVWHCPSCGQDHFSNPKPAVELAIIDTKGNILVSRRAREPYKGKLDLPGGFVDLHETLEMAVLREAKEELELMADEITTPQFFTSMFMAYTFQNETYQVLVSVFVAKLRAEQRIFKPHDDVAEVLWLNEEILTKDDFASDQHYTYILAILKNQS